jgi:hypothetical protein
LEAGEFTGSVISAFEEETIRRSLSEIVEQQDDSNTVHNNINGLLVSGLNKILGTFVQQAKPLSANENR